MLAWASKVEFTTLEDSLEDNSAVALAAKLAFIVDDSSADEVAAAWSAKLGSMTAPVLPQNAWRPKCVSYHDDDNSVAPMARARTQSKG